MSSDVRDGDADPESWRPRLTDEHASRPILWFRTDPDGGVVIGTAGVRSWTSAYVADWLEARLEALPKRARDAEVSYVALAFARAPRDSDVPGVVGRRSAVVVFEQGGPPAAPA